jgi:hypothetical protein
MKIKVTGTKLLITWGTGTPGWEEYAQEELKKPPQSIQQEVDVVPHDNYAKKDQVKLTYNSFESTTAFICSEQGKLVLQISSPFHSFLPVPHLEYLFTDVPIEDFNREMWG